jgi:hypothetical protein
MDLFMLFIWLDGANLFGGWMDESDMLSIWLDGVIFFCWMDKSGCDENS